jgi:hypothetical protein
MLADNLLNFQQSLHNILSESASAAFMTTIDNSGNMNIDKDCKNKLNSMADTFGKKFADEAAPELAKEIINYIKSASLNIIVQPQGLATILTAAGPCSGTLLINDGTATINIL